MTSCWMSRRVATVLGSNRKRLRPQPNAGISTRSPGLVRRIVQMHSRTLISPVDQTMEPSGPTRGGNDSPVP